MTYQHNPAIKLWLYIVAGLIVFMVVFGGLVRLTRSGLSIVEWNPVSGVIPPMGEKAWEAEFVKYKQTPEYLKVNQGMTLAEYKKIFLLEYIHRLIARFAGLIVALPLLWWLIRGTIPWRHALVYVLIGIGFAFQGALGWYMVSSGLVNRPAVSHFRLTAHLLTALALLALTLWMAFQHSRGFIPAPAGRRRGKGAAWFMLALLVLQIAYGGLVAGLKAGHVSDSWPLMFGRLIPAGLFATVQPAWKNLFEAATTVHFIHRWFAFAVLLTALFVWWKIVPGQAELRPPILLILALTILQIVLGISVIWLHVPVWLALLHQLTALCLFMAMLWFLYRVVYGPPLPEAV